MKITRIRDAVAPIPSPMRNAVISFDKMTISVAAVETDVMHEGKPVIGYGFTSNGRYAQSGIIRDRLAPRILETDPAKLRDESAGTLDPAAIWAAMMSNEKPGGHGDRAFAAGAIDLAVWDATAKILGKPLWRLLSERYNGGKFDARVLVYSGGGYYYPGKEKQGLQDEMRQCRDLGYRLLKMKIGGASLPDDLRRIEWALEIAGSGQNLAVDANGRFDLDTALAYARAMEPYGLGWFEEPVDPLDYRAHAVLCEATPMPVATGENLFSVPDFRNLVRHGGMRPNRDWLQPDPSLCYGLTEALRILDMAHAAGWARRRCVPHGGHQLGLNMAAGLQLGGTESYPGVFKPYGGFADGIPVADGYTSPHETPGIGIELRAEMFADMRKRLELA
ncbi:MAG TPA: enolase C-terminal domain-like protein [Hyphomicrobiaceae bacterium]|jgi:L-alanine-DL-glutamate epimerase-like enolase superfamily enzyme|nr:enolase C-terminal domain-like protein [Hyphomicrobiaceae bacterium]